MTKLRTKKCRQSLILPKMMSMTKERKLVKNSKNKTIRNKTYVKSLNLLSQEKLEHRKSTTKMLWCLRSEGVSR